MVATDPRTPNVLYASILGEEAVRSSDGGETWRRIGVELGVVAIDPAQPQTLYAAATGDPFRDRVLKSTDGGKNWAPANRGLRGTASDLLSPGVTAVVIDPKSPRTLYAATSSGRVFKSTNGGDRWSRVSRGIKGGTVKALAVHPRRTSTLYAGTETAAFVEGGRLFKSTDSGRSWRPTALDDSVISIAIDPQNPRTVYATSSITIYKSVDAGKRWTELTFPVDVTTYSLAIDRSRPDTVYVAAGHALGTDESFLFKSTNGGESWAIVARTNETVNELPAFFGESTLAVDPTGRRVYVGTAGAGILVCETCRTIESPRRATP